MACLPQVQARYLPKIFCCLCRNSAKLADLASLVGQCGSQLLGTGKLLENYGV